MKVSVIVATLNRKHMLAECLRSLVAQTYRDFEIVVVDGGSTDGTGDVVKRFPVRFLRQIGSVPTGENYGITMSRGEILAFVDDDVIAAANWLERLVESFERTAIDGVGGRIIQPDLGEHTSSNTKLSAYLRLRNGVFSIACENRLDETGQALRSGYVTGNFDRKTKTGFDVHTFQGCNMAIRRTVFEAVGLFDENYTPTSFRFETDFCLRAFGAGFRLIYNADAVVYHRPHLAHTSRPQGANLGRYLFYNAVNSFMFVMKRRKQIPRFSWMRFALVQVLFAEECLRLAIRRKKLAYLRGPWGTLVALRNWIRNSNSVREGRISSLATG